VFDYIISDSAAASPDFAGPLPGAVSESDSDLSLLLCPSRAVSRLGSESPPRPPFSEFAHVSLSLSQVSLSSLSLKPLSQASLSSLSLKSLSQASLSSLSLVGPASTIQCILSSLSLKSLSRWARVHHSVYSLKSLSQVSLTLSLSSLSLSHRVRATIQCYLQSRARVCPRLLPPVVRLEREGMPWVSLKP
jgi:hypothetical protein